MLLLAICISLPTAATVDFFWKQRDQYAAVIIRTFNTHQADVLYFGDSSIRYHGRLDNDTTGIDQIFQKKTGLSICSIANAGFSPLLYSQYIKLLDKTSYQPKLVIIPLNLRTSFTVPAARRPAFDFAMRQIDISFRRSGSFDLVKYLQYRFLGMEERLTESWKQQPVVYNGNRLGTHSSIQDDSRIPVELDYAPEREHFYARQLGLKYRYHYMAPLSEADEMFNSIDDIIKYARSKNIQLLFYLTPINYQDGKKYSGEAFTEQNNKNIATITKYVQARGVKLLNLANALSPADFVDKRDAYEHFNFKGRDFIAEQVAKAAAAFFPEKKW